MLKLMTPVYQKTKTDCMRCCLATLFDMEYDLVPDIRNSYKITGLNSYETLKNFLKSQGYEIKHLYKYIDITSEELKIRDIKNYTGKNGLFIASIGSHEKNGLHAIIIDYDFKIHFEPSGKNVYVNKNKTLNKKAYFNDVYLIDRIVN